MSTPVIVIGNVHTHCADCRAVNYVNVMLCVDMTDIFLTLMNFKLPLDLIGIFE